MYARLTPAYLTDLRRNAPAVPLGGPDELQQFHED